MGRVWCAPVGAEGDPTEGLRAATTDEVRASDFCLKRKQTLTRSKVAFRICGT